MFQYPGQPRLNRDHPLGGAGLRLAAVTLPTKQIYDLLSGQIAAMPGNGYQQIQTPGGPAFNSTNTTASPTFVPPISGETFSNYWASALFQASTPNVSMTLVGVSHVPGDPAVLTVNSSRQIFFGVFGNSFTVGMPVLVVGHMYFYIASCKVIISGSSGAIAQTLVDMTTGQVYSGAQATGGTSTPFVAGTNFGVGGQTSSATNAPALLRMGIGNQFVSQRQQLLIARKPWSLWHAPRPTRSAILAYGQSLPGNRPGPILGAH